MEISLDLFFLVSYVYTSLTEFVFGDIESGMSDFSRSVCLPTSAVAHEVPR